GFEVYIATNLPAGIYTSTITVYEGVSVDTTIPVQFKVYNATLPGAATIPVIGAINWSDIDIRYYNNRAPASDDVDPYLTGHLRIAAFLHRHKVIQEADNFTANDWRPSAAYRKYQDGSAFKE